jgi:hypothetical protein
MPVSTTHSTWESLRPSDGSPLVISFDWHEDHSAWRIEDLADQINEALTLLSDHGMQQARPDHVHELPKLVSELRTLHRERSTPDSVVRRALDLADELDLGSDIEYFDGEHEYECVLANLFEALDAWDDDHRWRWMDDEYYVYARKRLEVIQSSRHGLGDRWSVQLSDDRVELPDGSVVYGHEPDNEQSKLMDLVYGHIDREDDLATVAGPMAGLDSHTVQRTALLLESVVNALDEIDARTVQAAIDTASKDDIPVSSFEHIARTVQALAGEWHQDMGELFAAAAALNTEDLHA